MRVAGKNFTSYRFDVCFFVLPQIVLLWEQPFTYILYLKIVYRFHI